MEGGKREEERRRGRRWKVKGRSRREEGRDGRKVSGHSTTY